MGGTARMSIEPVKSRVALFIDFWNFTLNMKKLDESFLIDWFKIPSAFIQYLQGRRLDGLSDALEYAGCEVVGSYSPHDKPEYCAALIYRIAKSFLFSPNFLPVKEALAELIPTPK